MPPILNISHNEFNGAHAHAQKTIPLAPIHSFTIQKVPSLFQQSSIKDSRQSIILFVLQASYK